MSFNNDNLLRLHTDPKYRELLQVARKLKKTPEYQESVKKKQEERRKKMVKNLSGFFGKPPSGGKRKTRRKKRRKTRKNICGQKGGTYNFPPNRPDSTFSNIGDLKFILSFYSPHNNNTVIIKSYTGDEDEHQLEPELTSDTHILIVGADYGIPFFLLQGGGFEIKPKGVDEYLTYVSAQQGGARKKKGGRRKTRKNKRSRKRRVKKRKTRKRRKKRR